MATLFSYPKKRSLPWRYALALLAAGVVGGIVAWLFAKKQYHLWSADSHVPVWPMLPEEKALFDRVKVAGSKEETPPPRAPIPPRALMTQLRFGL